jgi:hypothetical protein
MRLIYAKLIENLRAPCDLRPTPAKPKVFVTLPPLTHGSFNALINDRFHPTRW